MAVSSTQQKRFAWMVVALLFIGSVLNYVDRAVLGVVKPDILRDLKLTNVDYGLAVNAFLMAYMVFYIVGGRLADMLGSRRMFTVTLIFWSAANMLHAAMQGLVSLCCFRALLGVGEGGYYPAAMRGSAEWFPAENRAKAVGLFLCGLCVGALIAPPLVAWITSQYGWRAAFLATGAVGFLLVPPWLFLHWRIRRHYGHPDPSPACRTEGRSEAGADEDLSLGEVMRRAKYWCLLASRALTDSAWWFYLFWMPGYFQDSRGFDMKMVGFFLWIPYFAADLGALAGAWASSALIRRGFGVDGGRKSIMVPSALMGACGALAHFVPDPALAVLIISVALFGHLSWSSNIHTAISEIAPPRHLAMLYGISGAVSTGLGALTQPAIGLVVDGFGYAPTFLGVGSVYLGAIGLLLVAGRIEPLRRTRRRTEPVLPTAAVLANGLAERGLEERPAAITSEPH